MLNSKNGEYMDAGMRKRVSGAVKRGVRVFHSLLAPTRE